MIKKEMVASRVYKMSANQHTVIFVKSLFFGGIISFQHKYQRNRKIETKVAKKRTTGLIISISQLIATIGPLVLQA
jgi:hypothetical protein